MLEKMFESGWGPWSKPVKMYNNDFVQISFRKRDGLVRKISHTIGIDQKDLDKAVNELQSLKVPTVGLK